jgi:hypothetical protein
MDHAFRPKAGLQAKDFSQYPCLLLTPASFHLILDTALHLIIAQLPISFFTSSKILFFAWPDWQIVAFFLLLQSPQHNEPEARKGKDQGHG